MQYEWAKKIENLKLLINNIEEFLRRNKFNVKTTASNDESQFKILAIPTTETEIRQPFTIEVKRTTNGTTIDFAPTNKNDESIKIGILSQFMIGGLLIMKGANKKEKMDALETEFWAHIQEFIAGLNS
jgi:hypothetical protein